LVVASVALGLVASVAAAVLWGLASVVARLGMARARPSLLNLVSVLVGIPILLAVLLATGQPLVGVQLSGKLLVLLSGVALCSQVGGALLTYDSIRFIGASRNATISSTRIVFSMVLGIALLGETLAVTGALGASLVTAGVLALAAGSRQVSEASGFRMRRGALEAVAGAVVFSLGNVFVRSASVVIGSAATANLLADLIALPILLAVVAFDSRGAGHAGSDATPWKLLMLSGAVTAVASYAFFVALSQAPVVYVIPLSSSNPLFAILFSWLAIRGMESLDRRVVLGALMTILGSVLIASPF
jgi:uncharacterized membrane protein